MNLLNVRRGQFVYYENILHKVYSVKPFFRKSVHLIRLRDYKQEIVRAKDIELHKPQHLDSFVCNYKRYTLHKDRKAEIGDFVLVTNPSPDYLDSHYLNAIEMVASIENNGIISNRMNGIKHDEYWVMVPGFLENARAIDFQRQDLAQDEDMEMYELEEVLQETELPKIGDVYQQVGKRTARKAMVVGIDDDTVYLGGDIEVSNEELMNPDRWSFIYNVLEQ